MLLIWYGYFYIRVMLNIINFRDYQAYDSRNGVQTD